jgi:vanillate O-demethylase monooxygenase subunit
MIMKTTEDNAISKQSPCGDTVHLESQDGIEAFPTNAWYVAAWSHELAEKPLARRVLDQPIVLFRDRNGKAAALRDACCHRCAPLSLGTVTDEGLQCGYHGLVFNRSGVCVHVPGQDRIPPRACVQHYEVAEQDKMVWIWMGAPSSADRSKILGYQYHNQPSQHPCALGFVNVAANYLLILDNIMDLTHVGYVHKSTIGGDPTVHNEAKMTVEPTEAGLRFTRWMLNSKPPTSYVKAYTFRGNIDRWQKSSLSHQPMLFSIAEQRTPERVLPRETSKIL